jgi:hypothetical protein
LSERLRAAASLAYDEPDTAYALCQEELTENPDSHAALTLAGVISCRAERYPVALAFFERAVKMNPTRAEGWNNLGTAFHELRQPLRAREAFRRAYELKEDPLYVVNIGVTFSDENNHREAIKWIRKAERMDPNHPSVPAALCFALLGVGDWSGWKYFDSMLGVSKFRKKLGFGGVDWTGEPVNRLIVYGEQGLGDEIMFASCLEDCRANAKQVVLECDVRLEGLFRRSFPWAEVHGTRRDDRDWDISCDAQVACGSLPALFRPTPESCPKTPYLTADPERRLMWRALFDSWAKPVIGIAWSGGRHNTGKTYRQVGLEAFRPLIETTDAVFVSLQYQDPSEEIAASGLPVREFALTTNYDDTAAMVAEMDRVIGPPTTVHHLAGALGKPSTILVPWRTLWDCSHGDRWPWYQSQTFHRQKKDEAWIDCLKRLT